MRRILPLLLFALASSGQELPPIGSTRFEAFAVIPAERNAVAAQRVAAGLGGRAAPIDPEIGLFEITTERPLSVAEAWELTHRVRATESTTFIEPLFEERITNENEPDTSVCNEKVDWHLKTVRAAEAWKIATKQGEGISIAHPDTGWWKHPETFGPRLDLKRGVNYVKSGGANGEDPLDSGLLKNPGHGTSTSSVIFSDVGKAPGSPLQTYVTGVAPRATLFPIRTSRSVVLFSQRNTLKAIVWARTHGAQVISISMGGTASAALHDEIIRATDAGIIIVAAAGNYVPFVVFPAAYSEVVAVAASDCYDREWKWTAGGGAVDITAPGHGVWRAYPDRSVNPPRPAVAPSSGTSYGVAITAGAAALWLEKHAAALAKMRPADRGVIPRAFSDVLRTRGFRTIDGWKVTIYGPGILDIERLLLAPMPKFRPGPDYAAAERRPAEAFYSADTLLGGHLDARAIIALEALLQRKGEDLLSVLALIGDELLFQIARDRAALRAFQKEDFPAVRDRLKKIEISDALRKDLR